MTTLSRGPRRLVSVSLLLLLVGSACAPKKKDPSSGAPAQRGAPAQMSEAAAYTDRSQENRLIGAVRDSFQRRNPRLAQVGILDLEAWDFVGPRIVLGWAIVGDHVFRGDFNDEMFGVFVVNDSLTTVERVIDAFPTERWFDYEVRFGRLTADSVEVLGRGATYGDDPTRRAYKWW